MYCYDYMKIGFVVGLVYMRGAERKIDRKRPSRSEEGDYGKEGQLRLLACTVGSSHCTMFALIASAFGFTFVCLFGPASCSGVEYQLSPILMFLGIVTELSRLLCKCSFQVDSLIKYMTTEDDNEIGVTSNF